MINILAYVAPNIPFFGADQQRVLLMLLSSAMANMDDFTKGAITKMILKVGATTSVYEKNTIIRCIEKIALLGDTPVIFLVSEGEDFAFEVTLETGKSFVGYQLRAYNAQTGDPLGPTVEGSAAPTQDVPVIDLALPQDHTYRCHVVLQQEGEPSNVLLTEAFVLVEDTIDYSV